MDNINNSEFWDQQYIENLDAWDLKTPTPIFIDLLNKGFFTLNSSLLVTGCGKGYDAVAAAKHGLNVYAVDFSVKAIEFAKTIANKNDVKINFIVDDIFNLPQNIETRYDYIFDYVTYCSFDPIRRREYAKTIFSLLNDSGRFVFILFPVEKREGGPPFGIDEDETKNIFSKFLTLELSEKDINSIKSRRGREILHIYQKLKHNAKKS